MERWRDGGRRVKEGGGGRRTGKGRGREKGRRGRRRGKEEGREKKKWHTCTSTCTTYVLGLLASWLPIPLPSPSLSSDTQMLLAVNGRIASLRKEGVKQDVLEVVPMQLLFGGYITSCHGNNSVCC